MLFAHTGDASALERPGEIIAMSANGQLQETVDRHGQGLIHMKPLWHIADSQIAVENDGSFGRLYGADKSA